MKWGVCYSERDLYQDDRASSAAGSGLQEKSRDSELSEDQGDLECRWDLHIHSRVETNSEALYVGGL